MRPFPNVIQLFGVVTKPELMIVTEFCDGGSLYAKLRIGITKQEQIQALFQIAKGMNHLHNEGIIHRDLAARNILLSSNGGAKVAGKPTQIFQTRKTYILFSVDFGQSRALVDQDTQTAAVTSAQVGPLKHMSPELLTNKLYSRKSDVWSFSVVIWEVLEKKDPYPELDAPVTAGKVMFQGLTPALTETTAEVFPGWLGIQKVCCRFDPEERPFFHEIVGMIKEIL